jgi:hypothetical protein
MQGSETFDGKMAGNRQLVDRYNEAKGKKKGEKHQARPKTGGGESGGAHGAGGHDEIKQIVGEHGPAHSVSIHHRGEAHPDGKYHTVSHHEDGHVHHADHDTLGDAHEHAAHAMDDTEHLGDMPKDDYEVAEEHGDMEREGSGSSGTSRVGYMS